MADKSLPRQETRGIGPENRERLQESDMETARALLAEAVPLLVTLSSATLFPSTCQRAISLSGRVTRFLGDSR